MVGELQTFHVRRIVVDWRSWVLRTGLAPDNGEVHDFEGNNSK